MKKSIKIMAIICGVIAVLVLFSAGRDLLIANGILPLPESKNELSVTNKYFLGSLDGYIIVLRFDDEEILHMAKCDPLTKKVTDNHLYHQISLLYLHYHPYLRIFQPLDCYYLFH